MALRNLKNLPGEVAGELELAEGLPAVRPAEEARLRGEVESAAESYAGIASGRSAASGIPLELDCATAAPVLAAYLRRRGFNARVVLGLYTGESPLVRETKGCSIATKSMEVAREIASLPESKRSVVELFRRDTVKHDLAMNNTHEFVLVSRDNADGKWDNYYADITYCQFGRDGMDGKFVFEAVDAKRLRDRFGLVMWSPEDQIHEIERDYRAAAGRPLSESEAHDQSVRGILAEMLRIGERA